MLRYRRFALFGSNDEVPSLLVSPDLPERLDISISYGSIILKPRFSLREVGFSTHGGVRWTHNRHNR